MDIRLKELLHNLKDMDWDVNPTYKIDENEARKIIQALDETDKKIADYTYMIGLLQDRIEEIEAVNKWIPLTKRPMTEEEYEYYKEWSDVECGMMFDCPLPEDGQEVLVSYGGFYVCTDAFCVDDRCYFDGVDIDDVQAWMPHQSPYKEEK